MKKIVLTILGFICVSLGTAQENAPVKSFTGVYEKTSVKATEDGSYIQVDFKGLDGKTTSFMESAETFMAEDIKKSTFTNGGASFGDVTSKTSFGKKFTIGYYISDAGPFVMKTIKLEAPVTQTVNEVASFESLKKEQSVFQSKHKCPSCPAEGAKEFIKTYIGTLNKQAEASTKPKEKESINKTISFLKESLAGNKFLTYYFTDTRASVLINKKFEGRYFAIQTKKESKWTGLGIDDDWANCHDLKKEDKVKPDVAVNCAIYFDGMTKTK